ncbi:MAG: sulfite exporter TauE/SafE family protein [Lautropia sp.]
MIWLLAYFVTGSLVGFLAGLLGIGGGMTLVPVLSAMFAMQQLAPDHTVHLALGTGMASVMFTSSASVREHHRHAAVDWSVVRRMVPGMVAGTLLSTFASGWISQRALALAFAVIVFGGATQMLFGRKPVAGRTLPGPVGLFTIGLAIGVISGLVSAGGTFLTVPFMLYCGVSMRVAIGTAAAVGIPVAVVGTIGYLASGLRIGGLPDWSIGFVYLPALVALVAASVLTAPLGARTTQRLPVAMLKRVFAVLLYALAARMVWSFA